MPPKPGFLLQDARGEMVLWVRTVGEVGPADGLNRPGRCVYDRQRLLHAAGARPGMQAESLNEALEGPRRGKGPHHQASPKVQKQQTPVPSQTKCFHFGRVGHCSSTCFAEMAREPYWRPKARSGPGNNELRGRYGI
ncbi:hypothetical protein TRVL_08941 [Trypanosoma vivax]|nr:hypothetical protein TRVL_08941 [Trypanosoma vivax]